MVDGAGSGQAGLQASLQSFLVSDINRRILRWAKETAGLTPEEAIRKLGVKTARSVAAAERLAVEQGIDCQFRKLGPVEKPLPLRSDNGAVFKSRQFRTLVRKYGLDRYLLRPRQGVHRAVLHEAERQGRGLVRTLKEQCLHGRSK